MKVYVVEGNIGSGKSTFIEEISKIRSNVIVIQEPVEQWYAIKDENNVSIFSHYYKNPEKFAFMFQMNVLSSRISAIRDAYAKNPQSVLIFERSIMTDKNVFVHTLHESGILSYIELQVFNSIYDNVVKMLSFESFEIDRIIYLQCQPLIAHERIRKRKRIGEDGISLQYIEALHERHESWLLHEELSIPVDVINNDDILNMENVCKLLEL
jgi:deoxyadenosine/deoxycytidine kinase